MVRLMKPSTLLDAIEVAKYQEQTVEIMLKKNEVKSMWLALTLNGLLMTRKEKRKC